MIMRIGAAGCKGIRRSFRFESRSRPLPIAPSPGQGPSAATRSPSGNPMQPVKRCVVHHVGGDVGGDDFETYARLRRERGPGPTNAALDLSLVPQPDGRFRESRQTGVWDRRSEAERFAATMNEAMPRAVAGRGA